jgi:hypothetical protein
MEISSNGKTANELIFCRASDAFSRGSHHVSMIGGASRVALVARTFAISGWPS